MYIIKLYYDRERGGEGGERGRARYKGYFILKKYNKESFAKLWVLSI